MVLILDTMKILKEACGDPPEARKKKREGEKRQGFEIRLSILLINVTISI